MTRDRSSSHDPTAAPSADESTQSASGLRAGRPGPGVVRKDETEDDDLVNRSTRDSTPRRYEQPTEDDPEGR
jgi:hypothetical protein